MLHLTTEIWISTVPCYDLCDCDAGKGKDFYDSAMFQCEIDKADHCKHMGSHVYVFLFSYVKIKIIKL
jgi:hypothetical protein